MMSILIYVYFIVSIYLLVSIYLELRHISKLGENLSIGDARNDMVKEIAKLIFTRGKKGRKNFIDNSDSSFNPYKEFK